MTIKHTLRVAGFVVTTMVFNHLIGVEDVGADLASPFHFFEFAFEIRNFIGMSLLLQFRMIKVLLIH